MGAPARAPLRSAAFTAFALLALTGCSAGTEPQDDTSGAEVAGIASLLASADPGVPNPTAPGGSTRIARSAPCPAGGTQSLTGTSTTSGDRATRVISLTWSQTHTQTACAVRGGRGGDSVTVVVDGSVTTRGAASYRIPEGPGEPRALLAYEVSRRGSTTATVGDRTRRCDVDTVERWDPASGTFTTRGAICGQSIALTRTPGGSGTDR